LSEGKTPDIRTEDYGIWANEVLEQLNIEKTIIAGASFGALVCLKLCMVAPGKVEKAVLLNPGCLQPFSFSFKNLYYNLLPLISPKRNNVEKFLDNAVFYKDEHVVSPKAKELIVDYELFAIKEFNDKAQKPYPMAKTDLESVQTDIYLVVGDKDILFPYRKSIRVARKHFRSLKAVYVLRDTGHGIETSKKAMVVLSAITTLETSTNN
jgi:pimeloyl-ACP methyl ester carboxylesterase